MIGNGKKRKLPKVVKKNKPKPKAKKTKKKAKNGY